MHATWRATLAKCLLASGILATVLVAILLSSSASAPLAALGWFGVLLLLAGSWAAWLDSRVAGRRQRALAIGLTHHLRTSLSHIQTFDEMLLLEPDAPEEQRRHWLEVIGREAHRLGIAVENLLYLIQDSHRREFPVRRPVDLGQLLEDVACDHAPRAECRLQLDVSPPSGIIVEADPDALRHALGNLLDGAVRTAREGSIIHASAAVATGGMAHVMVSFDPRDSEFEPPCDEAWPDLDSRRLEGCTDAGFGLELAVIRHVARQHGGQATRISDPQRHGFRVELPLAGG